MAPKQQNLFDHGQHRRILLVMLLLGITAFVPVALRLHGLMVRQYDHYASLALRNQTRTTLVTADRGIIYDRNMQILASSVSTVNVYLDPRELQQAKANLPALSEALGEILGKDPGWIEEKAGDRTKRYQQIAARVEQPQAEEVRRYINENSIYGVHLEPSSRRSYPGGTLAAQVIGFTDSEGRGVEGIELAYDRYLRGDRSRVITTKGNNEMDMPYSYEAYERDRTGCSLVLTLDSNVQMCLEKQLQAAMDRYQVRNGAFGVVMNCKTGEILAMATLGSYDPNRYQQIGDPEVRQQLEQMEADYKRFPEESPEYRRGKEAAEKARTAAQLRQWRNRVISDGYEPGSTFKILTMAAALDTGAIDLNTDFYCRGAEQIPGRAQLLHCWRHQGHGAEKTPQALQNSCNIAFAHIALKLGGQRFYDYIQRFGIREKTGIDLKGESRGVFFEKALITDTEKWGTASLTSGSFGQTFKLTPLQLVRAVASVVNGGTLPEPYLVSEILDSGGNTVSHREPKAVRRTISPETSRTMQTLLESVVTEGTAKNAAVSGYRIGGKTGTSEKIDVFDENGRRVLDKIVSFVGIAPMEDPEYIVLAALDTPSRTSGIYISGGVMAAPTVGAILEDILPYLGIPREQADGPELPELRGMPREEAEKQLKKLGLTGRFRGDGETITGQIPTPGECVPGESQILLYCGEQPGSLRVPDLRGMHRPQAEETAGRLGLRLRCRGNPEASPYVRVTAQDPAPDTLVPEGTGIDLEFTDTTVRD